MMNCVMMFRLRAPMARRMPISRVRCGHRDQHDVHDADAGRQERDGADEATPMRTALVKLLNCR